VRLRICTWNVNSVRLRAEQAARFIADHAPDVLCLQEIKCREAEFPLQPFIDVGLPHVRIAGQKGLHGVAIASRLPLEPGPALDVCRRAEARHVSAIVAGRRGAQPLHPSRRRHARPRTKPEIRP
jgi:exodeoxyribonuclease-3